MQGSINVKFPELLGRENIFYLCISPVYFLFEIVHIFCLFSAGALVAPLADFYELFLHLTYSLSVQCSSSPTKQMS